MTYNEETRLSYNLTGMMRSAKQQDFFYTVAKDSDSLWTYFVNICGNTKELCEPETPVCEQSLTSYPGTLFPSLFQAPNQLFSHPHVMGISLEWFVGPLCSIYEL